MYIDYIIKMTIYGHFFPIKSVHLGSTFKLYYIQKCLIMNCLMKSSCVYLFIVTTLSIMIAICEQGMIESWSSNCETGCDVWVPKIEATEYTDLI